MNIHHPSSLGLAVVAALLVGSASADNIQAYWKGYENNHLDVTNNWDKAPVGTNSTCYVNQTPSDALTLSRNGEVELFDGAMLRFQKSATMELGAGNTLKVSRTGASAVHAEKGAQAVLASGKIYAYRGWQYDGTFITDDSSFTVTGADSEFESPAALTLRSNSDYVDQATITRPGFKVLDGGKASFSIVKVGTGNGRAEGRLTVSGAGSKLLVKDAIELANQGGGDKGSLTNLLEVADGAYLVAKRLSVGCAHSGTKAIFSGGASAVISNLFVGCGATIGSNRLVVSSGAVVTNAIRFGIGCGKDSNGGNTKYDLGGDEVLVEGEGSQLVTLGNDVKVCRGSRLVLADGGRFEAKKGMEYSNANTAITSGTADIVLAGGALQFCRADSDGSTFQIPGYGRLVGDGGALEIVGNATFRNRGIVALTNATVSSGYNVSLCNPTAFKGGSIDCKDVFFDSTTAVLTLEDVDMTCGRFQMEASNSVLRLVNTRLTIPEDGESRFFMLGGYNSNAITNAFERSICVSGTNTYVRSENAKYGIYFRGTNNTINVDIPAEGFSTAHPVFETPLFYIQNGFAAHVVITVDPALAKNGGGEYVLFKGKNAHSEEFDYVYDPETVELVRRGDNGDATAELVIMVKSSRKGLSVLVR